jgi:hypothetical protein
MALKQATRRIIRNVYTRDHSSKALTALMQAQQVALNAKPTVAAGEKPQGTSPTPHNNKAKNTDPR